MNVYFHSYEEYVAFKRLIEPNISIVKETVGRNGFMVQLRHIPNDELIRIFIQIYIMHRLQTHIKKIIREDYFFTNETEVDQVIEWTNWLLQERTFIDEQFNEQTLFNYLLGMLLKHLRHTPTFQSTINFDTFVLFQFKTFHKRLIHIVGYAIDEMKREEEYQHFVQTARMYVQKHPPQTPPIHIIQDETYYYYNQFGVKITESTLVNRMKRMPLYLFGLDETELTIAPALSLLPEWMNIYGTNENDGKMITLLNIFEERAQFLPLEDFPFGFERDM